MPALLMCILYIPYTMIILTFLNTIQSTPFINRKLSSKYLNICYCPISTWWLSFTSNITVNKIIDWIRLFCIMRPMETFLIRSNWDIVVNWSIPMLLDYQPSVISTQHDTEN